MQADCRSCSANWPPTTDWSADGLTEVATLMAHDPRILITVSGVVPEDLDERVVSGERPRADYRVMAQRLGAEVVDVSIALGRSGRFGRALHRIGGAGPLLAWFVFRQRQRFDVVLTDGEQVGLPLALLARCFGGGGIRHAMIVHVVSVPKKARLMAWTGIASRIDRYVVYSSRQGEFLRDEIGVAPERITLLPFMVDTEFFSVDRVATQRRDMICSAGLERRDYPTLMRAVDGLHVDVVIAAASPWSKQADSSQGVALPSNVQIDKLSLAQLRDLYASSRFVVMPLLDVDFQAGITTILEAMAMGRPVICTRTAGQNDTVVEGRTGVYVDTGDADALRSAIEHWLAHPDEVAIMGAAAREWVVANADVEIYADRIASVIESMIAPSTS